MRISDWSSDVCSSDLPPFLVQHAAIAAAPTGADMSDLIPLAQPHCMPRKGSEHKLTQARIQELLPQVPGWKLAEDGHGLEKTYRFKNYYRTKPSVNALAHVANKLGREPAGTQVTTAQHVCRLQL